MKRMEVHPVSALFGAVTVGIALFLTSAQTRKLVLNGSGLQQVAPLSLGSTVTVEGIPTPQQMMRVVEGAPFVVPSGKLFVCTGLGAAANGASPLIRVVFDGTEMIEARPSRESAAGSVGGTGPSISLIPPGLVASEQTSVSVTTNSQASGGIILGYLADA